VITGGTEASEVISITKQMEFQIEHKIKGVTIFPSADDVITDAEQIINPNEDIVMGVETELVDVFGKI
jgi:hypothetical protein